VVVAYWSHNQQTKEKKELQTQAVASTVKKKWMMH
jgi:hypothetical protein